MPPFSKKLAISFFSLFFFFAESDPTIIGHLPRVPLSPHGPNNTSSRKWRGQHVQISVNSLAACPIFAHDLLETFSRGDTVWYQDYHELHHSFLTTFDGIPRRCFKLYEKKALFQVTLIKETNWIVTKAPFSSFQLNYRHFTFLGWHAM